MITVLPPIQEPAVNLGSVDPLALVTHLLGRVENDQLMDTANSLFQQLHVTIQNVAAGRQVTCTEVFASQGNHCGFQVQVLVSSKKLVIKKG